MKNKKSELMKQELKELGAKIGAYPKERFWSNIADIAIYKKREYPLKFRTTPLNELEKTLELARKDNLWLAIGGQLQYPFFI